VRFDDRLTTVLNQPARTRHEKAVRWRQLVDLIARAGPAGSSGILDQAIETVRAEAELVEEHLRAAAARSVAALPLPIELIEVFASDTLAVSAPVLAAASLDEKNWAAVMQTANPETRAFVAALHPGARGPASAEVETLVLSEPIPADTKPELKPAPQPKTRPESKLGPVAIPSQSAARIVKAAASVADVVARIERRKRPRTGLNKRDSAKLADSGQFNWECGPGGEIEWVDGVPRGAVVGASIAVQRSSANGGPDETLVRAFARRSPFRDARFVISGSGAAAGAWILSGVPAFDPIDGRFAGYRGVAVRDQHEKAAPPAQLMPASMTDPASLRELVHEIKTPLNAIIGFAEIIDGQYLGPADRRYRQRAGHIVGQARLLLGAIDDLDFAAKAHAQAGPATVNLAALMEEVIFDLRARARMAGAEIDLARVLQTAEAAIAPSLAERAIRSAFLAIIDQAGRGERLRLSVDEVGNRPRVALSRPRTLEGLSDAQLFGIAKASDESGPGIGFSLRLARGLARIAGIALNAGERDIALLFDPA
jgi:hypothetical protein